MDQLRGSSRRRKRREKKVLQSSIISFAGGAITTGCSRKTKTGRSMLSRSSRFEEVPGNTLLSCLVATSLKGPMFCSPVVRPKLLPMSVAFLYINHMIIFYKKQGMPGLILLAAKKTEKSASYLRKQGEGKEYCKKNQLYRRLGGAGYIPTSPR